MADAVISPGGQEAIAHLHSHYRLIAVADAVVSSSRLRRELDAVEVAGYFDGIVTSAGMGPEVTPRIIRRIVKTLRTPDSPVVVTARKGLARALSRSRLSVVLTTPSEFAAVPEAVASLLSGRVSP